ncbi:LAFA_0F21352g1_1 [Lachancea sp. 'fantastica']|nr:LAFA_0F21352g1_1 [Lachancea sp. 'fantastica']
MSACQPSALARLVSKTDQFPAATKAFTQNPNFHSNASRSRPQEKAGFDSNGRPNRFLEPPSGSHVIQGIPPPQAQHIGQDTQSWADQFSRMQLHDPLSFTNEYQQLYKQYETSQQPPQPQQQPQHYQPLASANTPFALQQPIPVYRPTLAQEQAFYASTSGASTQSDITTLEKNMFAQEFDKLESELGEEPASFTESASLSHEQLKFQQAASEINNRFSPGTETPPQLESKFQNSKFMGLIRNISDGVVTLKTDDRNNQKYTHLFSPSTGELVGNEYFPVSDATLGV